MECLPGASEFLIAVLQSMHFQSLPTEPQLMACVQNVSSSKRAFYMFMLEQRFVDHLRVTHQKQPLPQQVPTEPARVVGRVTHRRHPCDPSSATQLYAKHNKNIQHGSISHTHCHTRHESRRNYVVVKTM
eukprot:249483-Amphidinium_carterae.1